MTFRNAATFLIIVLALGPRAEAGGEYFEIRVVDEETGRGVPLVELETTNNIRYVTDSAGRVAFHEPGLAGKTVFFHVRSHGYEFPADGFGYYGTRIDIEPGGKKTIEIHRINIAERLYRITGGGIYRDSVLLGHKPPIKQPLLNARVLGSDSVINAVHNGKLHWFWGDTNRPAYPLGNFHVPGATSKLPDDGGLDPDVGVKLNYYVGDDGFARPTAKMPGDGPTWIGAATTLTNKAGREHIYAAYAKIEPPLTTYARGLIRFNDESNRFEKIQEIPLDAPIRPDGHPLKHVPGESEYVYFATPYPLARVEATPEDYQTIENYEAFTCLAKGSTLEDPEFDRTADGTLRYAWKRDTPAIGAADQTEFVKNGTLAKNECIALRDVNTGKKVVAHGGSVYWNDYRQRWIMVFVQAGGDASFLGEVWYAEADSPIGPWAYAVKIATHDRYDFYNPKQHPAFDQRGGKTIFFEGTYTNTFSGHPMKTPRYDYNQMMYKLRLDEARAALPVPIYYVEKNGESSYRQGGRASPDEIAFFALDRPTPQSIPVYQTTDKNGTRLSTTPDEKADQAIAFHALAANADDPPAATENLHRYVDDETGRVRYLVESAEIPSGFRHEGEAVCRVWKNPIQYTWETEP